jgi:hypothetical protein
MITRHEIYLAKCSATAWFSTHIELISDRTREILRGDSFVIDNAHYRTLLGNITFLYNDTDQHWAETDGETIWLNTFKNWTPELLHYTLIHECIHGLIKRTDGNYLSEPLEHRLMETINTRLI